MSTGTTELNPGLFTIRAFSEENTLLALTKILFLSAVQRKLDKAFATSIRLQAMLLFVDSLCSLRLCIL